MDLFTTTEPQFFDLQEATIELYSTFYSKQEAEGIFELLLNEIPWQQDLIKVFGKIHPQPRLTALFGEDQKSYTYSNITMQSHDWTATLLSIKSKIEQAINVKFNSVLLNYYRDGKDSNGWHADNEKELGNNPTIASLSFGATRTFHLKHNTEPNQKKSIQLESGSLLVMSGSTQHYWKHQIPKTTKIIGPRINLTFRILQ